MQLFFFSEDGDGHWYMIPASKRERWEEVNNMDPNKKETWEDFAEFEQYRLSGGISHIEFMCDLKYIEE